MNCPIVATSLWSMLRSLCSAIGQCTHFERKSTRRSTHQSRQSSLARESIRTASKEHTSCAATATTTKNDKDHAPLVAGSTSGSSDNDAFNSRPKVPCYTWQSDKECWNQFHSNGDIGKGSFSKVVRLQRAGAGQQQAVKVLDKVTNDIDLLVAEYTVHRAMLHPNIALLHEVHETASTLYLVMELAEGGPLISGVTLSSRRYSERRARKHVKAIVGAVQHIHSKGCVHRDLKPENILLSGMTEDAVIKIIDFGLSRFNKQGVPMRTMCGTHGYLAPEVVLCDREIVNGYDEAIDLWGCGLVAIEMIFGFNPFKRASQCDTYEAIIHYEWVVPRSIELSSNAKEFLRNLTSKNPEARYTAEEAEGHEWLQLDSSTQRLQAQAAGSRSTPRVVEQPTEGRGQRAVSNRAGNTRGQGGRLRFVPTGCLGQMVNSRKRVPVAPTDQA